MFNYGKVSEQRSECDRHFYNQFEPSPTIETQISSDRLNLRTKFLPDSSANSAMCVMAYFRSEMLCKNHLKRTIWKEPFVRSRQSPSILNIRMHWWKISSIVSPGTGFDVAIRLCLSPTKNASMNISNTHGNHEKMRISFCTSFEKLTQFLSRSKPALHTLRWISCALKSRHHCMACFALLHEVLVVSVVDNAVWMVEP